MPSPVIYALLMVATGIGIPVMAALNGVLGTRYGSTALAASILFFVGLVISLAFLFFVQGVPKAPAGASLPPHFYLGGVLVAFYVLSITWVAPRFGVGNAVAFVLLGQLISMAVIDHFGLMRANVSAVTPTRLAGLLLMTVGVFLAVRRG